MRKIYSMLAVVCVATLFASSCAHNQSPEMKETAGEVEVEMNIIASSLNPTRAWVDDEDRINNLYVLVFDASAAETTEDNATFLYCRHAWSSGLNTYRTMLKTGVGLNIYFAANTGETLFDGLTEGGMTYTAVRDALILANPDLIAKDNIPMWGIALDQTIGQSDGFVSLGTVRLLRSVASADLEIKATGFEFESAGLVLATDKGFLTHKADNVTVAGNQIRIDAPKVPTGAAYNFGNGYWWKYTPVDNKVENKLYLFENDATAATAPHKRHTKLIVAGRYDGGDVTYYPLAFRGHANEKVQAARNRKFELTVTKVNGHGYASVDDAIDAQDVNMEYKVMMWDDGYKDGDIIISGSEYVSFPGGKTVLLADQTGSDILSRFSSNALVWNEGSPSGFGWSLGGGMDTEVATNPISNGRFEVEIVKDASDAKGESYYLKATALKAYHEDAALVGREAILSLRIGRIRFEVRLRQVENGWNDGGSLGVEL